MKISQVCGFMCGEGDYDSDENSCGSRISRWWGTDPLGRGGGAPTSDTGSFQRKCIGGSRGVPLAHAPPTGSISFIFAYIFAKKCMRRRLAPPPNGSAPPKWEILDLPLEMYGKMKELGPIGGGGHAPTASPGSATGKHVLSRRHDN